MNLNVCGNCSYFVSGPNECHFNPPTVFMVMTQSKMAPGRPQPAFLSSFPGISKDCPSCSHFAV